MQPSDFDAWHMARAIELAARGEGLVEPNPMVGCTIVRDGETVGEGYHERFGGPHAEIVALARAKGLASGATVYTTLEPCCHQGKTGPCSQALIRARVARVVVAQRDPFPQVAGGGIAQLRESGIAVDVGLLETEAQQLNAPYLKLVAEGRPWVIAKWAMTLDGKMATHGGDSRWISGESSRAIVHRLRGRVDGILVGIGTALADNPRLTARPPGARVATRIVVDSHLRLPPDSELARTARETPVLVVGSAKSPGEKITALEQLGCEVVIAAGDSHAQRTPWLLDELGRRRMTNLLVEGGGTLLGQWFDLGQIDEVHAFIAPKLIGGAGAKTPLEGQGRSLMEQAVMLDAPRMEQSGADLYVRGRVRRS